jgi:hypothetical protein
MKRFILLAVLMAALPASGQLYKWTDANGRVQYTDTPPSGVKAELVKGRISSVQSNSAGQPETAAEQEQGFRKRQAQAQEDAKKQETIAQRDQEMRLACANARSRVAGLEAGGRQVRFDANGQRQYLDDNQVAQEKAQAQQDASKYCK